MICAVRLTQPRGSAEQDSIPETRLCSSTLGMIDGFSHSELRHCRRCETWSSGWSCLALACRLAVRGRFAARCARRLSASYVRALN